MRQRYRAAVLMLAFFAVSLGLHFWLGWQAAIEDAATHGQTATWSGYLIEWGRDTFENWQSEFLQLAVQMALLAGFFKIVAVKAYEEDNEQIKRTLGRIEADVIGLTRKDTDA